MKSTAGDFFLGGHFRSYGWGLSCHGSEPTVICIDGVGEFLLWLVPDFSGRFNHHDAGTSGGGGGDGDVFLSAMYDGCPVVSSYMKSHDKLRGRWALFM